MSTEQNSNLEKFERHLRVLKGLEASSVRAYRRMIEEFLSWRMGNDDSGPLAGITRSDIEEYLFWCYRNGNQASARATKHIALQNYFRYLVYAGELPADPTAGIPRTRYRKEFMTTLNQDEVLRMFAACDVTTAKGLRDAAFLVFAAFAGFRVSEIVNFNIEQISDDGKEVDLDIPKTKRGAGRTVYLWKMPANLIIRPLLLTRLEAGARPGDPLLVNFRKGDRPRGDRLSTKALDDLVKQLARKAGIRKAVKSHALRATHACDLQRISGYTMQAIMERLGIKNLATLEHYLVRRERIHKSFPSLHAYWLNFGKVWTKGDSTDDSNRFE